MAPKRQKTATELKLDETMDLLEVESQKNVFFGNENELLRIQIQELEKEKNFYLNLSSTALSEIEELKADIKSKEVAKDSHASQQIVVDAVPHVNDQSVHSLRNRMIPQRVSTVSESNFNSESNVEAAGGEKSERALLSNVSCVVSQEMFNDKENHSEVCESQGEKSTLPQCNIMNDVDLINDIMKAGFPDNYLRKTKWSNQAAKKGKDVKKGMDQADQNAVIDLAFNNWCDLPVSPDVLQKWIISGIKQVFNNKGRHPRRSQGGVKEVDESFDDEEKGSTVGDGDKLTGKHSPGSLRGKNARSVEDDPSSNNENIFESEDDFEGF